MRVAVLEFGLLYGDVAFLIFGVVLLKYALIVVLRYEDYLSLELWENICHL